MLKVKTSTGFTCKIDESILNRYAFVKLLARVEKSPMAITEMITMLLGDQEEALIEHLGGNPSVEEVTKQVTDIFDAIKENNEAKKS